MRHPHIVDICFLLVTIVVSLVGFASLGRGNESLTGYHVLHIGTSLAWLLLLLVQLVLVGQRRLDRHRAIGLGLFVAGPVLVASSALLTVHSAAKEVVTGTADFLVVQNVAVTVELAILLLLGFALRRNRNLHGAALLSSGLLFLAIALFFTLIAFIPGFRVDGPETFSRFATAARTAALIGSTVGVGLFLRQRRSGWPWLLVAVFFQVNGLVQGIVAERGYTMALTTSIGGIGELRGFVGALVCFGALLAIAWRVGGLRQARRARTADAAPRAPA